MISVAGKEYSDGVGWNVLHALLDTIAAGGGFLGFSGASDYGVNRRAIYYGDILSKGCEKEKIAGVNHIVGD